jgi:2-keto-4-pentenoate hydratase/2-oxohepta-3-ene-1,7-dioic acid hydratase in catechol pathway
MKLARYNEGRIGVVVDRGMVDVSDIVGSDEGQFPPVSMTRLISGFDGYRDALTRAALTRPAIPLASVKLLTPVPWPNKVIAYPVNYHDHAAEMGANYRATLQGWFLKPNSSLSGAGEPIELPDLPGRRMDHESELAIIIGKQGRNIDKADWKNYVFGYACLLDMVVRGKEERVFRKGFDTFCPVGPWIATADEVADPSCIDMKLWVNGELRQDANTRDLVLDIPGMIEMAAAVATLYPGDIIATGTPAGVGPVKPGDTVRISIEGVGEMSVPVVQGKGGRTPALAEKPAA